MDAVHANKKLPYRFLLDDEAVHLDDVAVVELAHNGGLLQEPDFVLLVRVSVERLDSHRCDTVLLYTPFPSVDGAELPRAKVISQTVDIQKLGMTKLQHLKCLASNR